MQYSAVIFDLFATLVDFSPRAHHETVLRMATALAVPHVAFARIWSKALHLQEHGYHQTVEDSLEYACHILNVEVDASPIAQATRLYLDFQRGTLIPRRHAIEILRQVRATGCKTGLISNCPSAVKFVWPETPLAALLDVTVFSYEVGLLKPDAQIYRVTCERLGTAPQHCLYVGDGGGGELTGAMKAGMHAVLLQIADEDFEDAQRLGRETWQGTTIATLPGVLALAGI